MSRNTATAAYPTINTVGALLPRDLIERLSTGDLDGMKPADYDLPDAYSLRQAAARAWELLLPTYRTFRQRIDAMPAGDPATVPTRDRWVQVLLRELGYDLTDVSGITVDGDTFEIRHLYGHVPVHILGWNVDLDRRAATNIRGASRTAPHSLVQELLNRADEHLWAILTNGKRLRLLRDNVIMGRPAYTEFDLEGMFDGEQFADFAVMFAVIHATRFRSGKPEACWLERWRTTAIGEGTRALDNLRVGVTQALTTLGTGFLEHPDNQELRDLLTGNHGATTDYYRWLLRLVYRLIFLFVAEDRDLLHPDGTSAEARRWYADYFSTARLRRLADRRRGGRHADLWVSLCLVFDALGNNGELALGLSAYGSVLFEQRSVGLLHEAKISNDRLLDAVRFLSQLPDRASGTMRTVDYKNLGAEELGSVYEALLEYVPTIADGGVTFKLSVEAGNARKTSGSYYTPTELVELVLDEALDPLLNEAMQAVDPVSALLALTICDPACGSGHFLVAAARRIARRVAIARTGDPEPTPGAVRDATRDVVAHCIYGVDLNDLAAELAKISLWLEALSPGKPLTFLDAHIKVGNALLGTTPALLAGNIPDDAFSPLLADDRKYASAVKKRNRSERLAAQSGQDTLFRRDLLVGNAGFATALSAVEAVMSNDIEALRKQADAWRRVETDPELQRARLVGDAWCAAFVWTLDPSAEEHVDPITHETLIRLQEDPLSSSLRKQREVVELLARRYRFFHWHLEFPQVFRVDAATSGPHGWSGGFDCVIGNPPWERVKVQDEEFFLAHGRADIANARTAALRRGMIQTLTQDDPTLYDAYSSALREAEGMSHLLRVSGRFPLTGRGDVNTFQVFAEHFRDSVAAMGQAGIVVPTGIATTDTTAAFFADTLRSKRLAALYDFENEAKIFAGVHNQLHFCVLATTGWQRHPDRVNFAFFTRYISDLDGRRFSLSPEEVLALNPNTGTCPIFRNRIDAEITLGAYRRHPVLIRDGEPTGNPWGLTLLTMFHMTNDSGLFRSASDLESSGARFDGFAYHSAKEKWLPLLEAKFIWHFDHRASTYDGATQANLNKGTLPQLSDEAHGDPRREVLARHWVSEREVDRVIGHRWSRQWILGWRDVTNAVSERTLIPAVVPRAAIANSLPIALVDDPRRAADLQAALSSLSCDFIVRQKLSGAHINFFTLKQVAVPSPSVFDATPQWAKESLSEWLRPRVLELTFNSWLLCSYAADLGMAGLPFQWRPERRALIQAEVDAAMLHVYGFSPREAEHILDSFFVLRKYEERDHGEFRTKRLVLRAYKQMSAASTSGGTFVSSLDPAPGEGPRHKE